MKNRLARLLKVLEWYPRSGAPDIDSIALQLGTTPATVRRDLRDLREAGAFDGENRPKLASPPSDSAPSADATAAAAMSARDVEASTSAPKQPTLPAFTLGEGGPANDSPAKRSSKSKPDVRRDDELVAMYVGARFLASEGDAALSEQALLVAHAVEKEASPELIDKLAELDTRYRFGPREAERKVRRAVAQAIAERRALEIRYKGERDTEFRVRVVEPTAQFFIHDRWSFYAYDRDADEVRQFRHERCKDVVVTDQPFSARSDRSLDGFVAQRRRAGR
ncbi:MAG: WYL domain-containing protein [Myxococcales bacterium]|nr:WYL domain-containing protein [Myxococcales bacterium]